MVICRMMIPVQMTAKARTTVMIREALAFRPWYKMTEVTKVQKVTVCTLMRSTRLQQRRGTYK